MATPAPGTTSLAELRNPPALQAGTAVTPGFGSAAGFELLQRGAKMLAASPFVPEAFRGENGIASCCVALELALRMNASPMMVMQNLDVIHGRPSWRAKFLIAAFNACGRFSAIRYRWQGTEGKDDWGCRAWAIEKSTGEEIIGPLVTIGLAKAEKWFERSGSKWKTIPELMLTYRAAAWMVNTHAPDLTMGLPTEDEARDVIDVTPERITPESMREATRGTSAQYAETVDQETGEIIGGQQTSSGDTDLAGGLATAVAAIKGAIAKARTIDEVRLQQDLTRHVPDEKLRTELETAAREKVKELGEAAGA